MSSLTDGTAKQLLEIEPEAKNPLTKTIIGRLVSQLQREPAVGRILIMTNEINYQYFVSWLEEQKALAVLSKPLEILCPGKERSRELEIIKNNLGAEEKALVISGDLLLGQENIRRALRKTEKIVGLLPLLHLVFGQELSDRRRGICNLDVTCWVINRPGLEMVLEKKTNPENFFNLLKLAAGLLRRGHFGISLSRAFFNINSPSVWELAKERLINSPDLFV